MTTNMMLNIQKGPDRAKPIRLARIKIRIIRVIKNHFAHTWGQFSESGSFLENSTAISVRMKRIGEHTIITRSCVVIPKASIVPATNGKVIRATEDLFHPRSIYNIINMIKIISFIIYT